MSYLEGVKDWVKNESKYWVTVTTGLMCEANIAFAAYEQYSGISDGACWGNRGIATFNAFLGIGYLYSRILDISDKVLKIDRSKQGSKLRDTGIFLHDAFYAGAFTIGLNSIIYPITNYFAENPMDLNEILGIAAASGIIGVLNGGFITYSRDVFSDLVGLKKCDRYLYPNIIKNRSSKLKKFLAAGFVATSIGILAGIIELTPNNNSSNLIENVSYQESLEEIVANN